MIQNMNFMLAGSHLPSPFLPWILSRETRCHHPGSCDTSCHGGRHLFSGTPGKPGDSSVYCKSPG